MSKTILLVEDDLFLSSLLKTRLEKEGLLVSLAKTSDEALSALRQAQGKPDLILMDIILPGKSGFEAMEMIAAEPAASKIPVMIISNLGQESDIARGKQLGAVDYLVKAQTPIDELVKKVLNFLSGGLSTP